MSKIFKVGERVAAIDDDINGVVVEVKNNQVIIKTDDDFLMTYFVNELVINNNIKYLDSITKTDYLHKKESDLKPSKNKIQLEKKLNSASRGVPGFDLHIEKLVKTKAGLSNFDILNLQLDTAKRHIEFAIKNRIPKIVLVHGVGEGVLKTELEYLFKKYPQITYQDANYQKYGLGATELYFKQNIK